MSTASYKRTYNLPFTFADVLKLIKSFSIEDKLRLEKELEKETLAYRAQKLSDRVKPNKISIDEVAGEIAAYRKEHHEEWSIHSG